MKHLRLGLNIDHVATVRNARGGTHPDPIRAALLGEKAGADGITAHLREDRRHIRDDDIKRLTKELTVPLNFEMAATDEMLRIALDAKPNACCLVPERREELTTEGGLNVVGQLAPLKAFSNKLKQANIRVSLFIDPEMSQVDAAKEVGADIVEFHTGTYVHACFDDMSGELATKELDRIIQATQHADQLGLECHAGHGLTFDTVAPIAAIPEMVELNIGHFLIGEAVFLGLEEAVNNMRAKMNEARR